MSESDNVNNDLESDPLLDVNTTESDRTISSPPRVITDKRQIAAACIVGIASFTMGLSFGYSSSSIIALKSEGLLSNDEQASWFASFLLVGAPIGSILGAVLVEKAGRKAAILFGGLPSVVGWVVILSASGYLQLCAGRLVAGIGLGIVAVAVPTYTAEIATPRLRGRLGGIHQLAITLGLLLAYAASMVITWRWLAAVSAAFVMASVTLTMCVPESPTWLLARYADARQAALALLWLRGGTRANIDEELCELRAVSTDDHQAATLRELTRERALYRPVIVGVVILTVQQLTGITAVMFYADSIFLTAGFANSVPGLPALIVACIQVVITAGSSLAIDAVGRRPLLLVGGVIMCVSSALCGLYYLLVGVYALQGVGWLSLGSLIGVVVGFSIGWGPVPWLILSEILPVRVKGVGTGLANFW